MGEAGGATPAFRMETPTPQGGSALARLTVAPAAPASPRAAASALFSSSRAPTAATALVCLWVGFRSSHCSPWACRHLQ